MTLNQTDVYDRAREFWQHSAPALTTPGATEGARLSMLMTCTMLAWLDDQKIGIGKVDRAAIEKIADAFIVGMGGCIANAAGNLRLNAAGDMVNLRSLMFWAPRFMQQAVHCSRQADTGTLDGALAFKEGADGKIIPDVPDMMAMLGLGPKS